MTILILDNDLKKSCEYLDDKSLDKQIKFIAQTLCDVHWELLDYCCVCDEEPDHTCDVTLDIAFKQNKIPLKQLIGKNLWRDWAMECKANYLWLIEYGIVSCDEHADRFFVAGENRPIVKYERVIEWARDNVPDLPDFESCGNLQMDITPLPLVMPKKYLGGTHADFTIACYRNYYKSRLENKAKKLYPGLSEKKVFRLCDIEWTRRERPEFLGE